MNTKKIIQKGEKRSFPSVVKPMECLLVREVHNDAKRLYELKLDGYRIVAHKNKDQVVLHYRNAQNYTSKYPPVAVEISELKMDVVLDGEVVVFDEQGKPSFDLTQKQYKGGYPIFYYVFDIIWIDGYDVTGLALSERKQLLQELNIAGDVIRIIETFEDGHALFEQVKEMGLEGVVSKQKDSRYEQGKRSGSWEKTPTEIRQEFVIGGWQESTSGIPFRTIMFGAYDNANLYYIGHSGSGFKESVIKDIYKRLSKDEIEECPFVNEKDIEIKTKAHWCKPIHVGNFKFSTWTKSGMIRKPAIFLGFREDKDPKDVAREVPADISTTENSTDMKNDNKNERVIKEENKSDSSASNKVSTEGSNWPELERVEITSKDVFTFGDCDIELTNVEKALWEKEKIPKAQLIQYYHSVQEYILPYLRDRPLSLHVKHIAPNAPGLYIKDMEGHQPECADIFSTPRKHKKKGKRDVIDYLICNNEATLLYMINLGCIDVNPWNSRVQSPLKPDYIVIDLDPSDEDFNKVIETAKAAKEYFDANKLKAFPKTSGKTGMHLYLPCSGFNYKEARFLAKNICTEIHLMVPEITTVEVSIAKRGSNLFVDFSQNDEADTLAAPYSVRPYKIPSVSTPLEWKEVNDKLHPSNFTIENIGKRIEKKGDLFNGVLDKKNAEHNNPALRKML